MEQYVSQRLPAVAFAKLTLLSSPVLLYIFDILAFFLETWAASVLRDVPNIADTEYEFNLLPFRAQMHREGRRRFARSAFRRTSPRRPDPWDDQDGDANAHYSRHGAEVSSLSGFKQGQGFSTRAADSQWRIRSAKIG